MRPWPCCSPGGPPPRPPPPPPPWGGVARFHGGGARPGGADSAVRKLLLGLIPHEQRVRVPRGSIVVCGAFINHAVDIRPNYTTRDGSLYVVIELGNEFAGKEILMKINKADTGASVSEERYTWGEDDDIHPFKEDIATLVAKGGLGKYCAAYFMGGRKIGNADFHIRKE